MFAEKKRILKALQVAYDRDDGLLEVAKARRRRRTRARRARAASLGDAIERELRPRASPLSLSVPPAAARQIETQDASDLDEKADL